MSELKEPRKPRSKRRNFERELETLAQYCHVMISAFTEIGDDAVMSDRKDAIKARIAAYQDVLDRLESK